MADYNPNYMAAYKQYGESMIAGGGGSNLSGTGSSTMQIWNYGNDNDDRPTGLASRPQQTTTQEDDKPSFWDRITSLFEQNEVDVTNVYQPSVNPAAVYDGSAFQVDDVSDYVYRAEMSEQTQDVVEQAMGYEKPQLGQLQLLDTRAMTEKEKERLGPLINLADDIRNQNITTTELPPIEGEEQSSLMDALMEGQPTAGLMSRPSSFTGESVQVASNIPNWMQDMSAIELTNALVGIKEGTVDPETGQRIQSAEDVQSGLMSPEETKTYNVKSGDTLYSIAKKSGVTLAKLVEANPDIDPDKISIDQSINIPVGAELSELPADIQQTVAEAKPKTDKELNAAIFDGANFSGEIATPKPGDDPLTWIAQNTYGLNENDPNFRKAFETIAGIDPKKIPWCGAFANHVLKNMGVDLPERAQQNPLLAFNYVNLGKEVYNHNPTTNKTYAGKLSDVKSGDVVVFNNSDRDNKGNISYGTGHVAFVVGTDDDGSIIAVGGNQGGGKKVTTTKYTPAIIKKYFKGGYTVRRINSGALEQTDPAIIAAITKDISMGSAER